MSNRQQTDCLLWWTLCKYKTEQIKKLNVYIDGRIAWTVFKSSNIDFRNIVV